MTSGSDIPAKLGSQDRPKSDALRPLRALMVLSLVGPVLLFAYAAILNYRAAFRSAEDVIVRTLDVVEEHALKVLEVAELTIDETDLRLQGRSDAEIAADEESVHRALAALAERHPDGQSIFVIDRTGRGLASSAVYPMPHENNAADRDYFAIHRNGAAGSYISGTIRGRIVQGDLFVLSRRRPSADGSFNGVTTIAVERAEFDRFYDGFAHGTAILMALVREDGALLARFPRTEVSLEQLPPLSGFLAALKDAPIEGEFTTVSPLDGIERMIRYRRLPNHPIYAQAGIERGAVVREWATGMASHLIFGVPATAMLFAISLMALRRTQREQHALSLLEEEVRRRSAAEQTLRQAQKMEALGQLTGGVAHDVNNLLLVINGNAELLRNAAPDEASRIIETIQRAVARGESLTRQLLAFSRQQALQPRVIDLHTRIPKMMELIRRSLRGDIEVTARVERDVWLVEVDPGELELAMLNIAVNARDAMPRGGSLRIAVRNRVLQASEIGDVPPGEYVEIAASDSGGGIPPEILPRVFEPFFTTKEVGKGTGLGLSQVYGFARQTGGTALAASAPGAGATISLLLPRTAKPLPAAAAPTASGGAHGGGRILLVEDNPEVAEVTSKLIRSLGYTVATESTARAALDTLSDGEPVDLVLSDIVMPEGMSGLDLAHEMRRRHPEIPVLLTTGYSQSADSTEFPILRKPYKLADLDQAIRERLRRAAIGAMAAGPASLGE